MPKCGCCGESFESDKPLVKHLTEEHDWDELTKMFLRTDVFTTGLFLGQ